MKPIREMNDEEFKEFVGCDREIALNMLLYHAYTSLSERPMLPGTKLAKAMPFEGRLLSEFMSSQVEEKKSIGKVINSLISNVACGVIEN